MEAVAKHDFNANEVDELSFRKSQILKVSYLQKFYSYFWRGTISFISLFCVLIVEFVMCVVSLTEIFDMNCKGILFLRENLKCRRNVVLHYPVIDDSNNVDT